MYQVITAVSGTSIHTSEVETEQQARAILAARRENEPGRGTYHYILDGDGYLLPSAKGETMLLFVAILHNPIDVAVFPSEEEARRFVDGAGYAQTQETLKAKGLLTKIGALTISGKNAAASLRF